MLIILASKTSETSLLSSPPKYENRELQQIIDNKKNESRLSLSYKGLTDDDMEIVGYYLLENNKVSDVVLICDY